MQSVQFIDNQYLHVISAARLLLYYSTCLWRSANKYYTQRILHYCALLHLALDKRTMFTAIGRRARQYWDNFSPRVITFINIFQKVLMLYYAL